MDPAASSGVAIWAGAWLVEVTLLKRPSHADWRRVLAGCSRVVLEDVYVRPDVSRASYGTMRATGGVLRDAAREVGAVVVARSPSSWRAPLGFPKASAAAKATALATLRALVTSDPRVFAAAGCVADRQLDQVEAVCIGISEMIREGAW